MCDCQVVTALLGKVKKAEGSQTGSTVEGTSGSQTAGEEGQGQWKKRVEERRPEGLTGHPASRHN